MTTGIPASRVWSTGRPLVRCVDHFPALRWRCGADPYPSLSTTDVLDSEEAPDEGGGMAFGGLRCGQKGDYMLALITVFPGNRGVSCCFYSDT